MTTTGYALFATPIGDCAIAWSDQGVTGVWLPEEKGSALRARLERRFPSARESAPPPAAQEAIDGIARLLGGEPHDLGAVALDMRSVPEFARRVYEVARTIPVGRTLTYGEIARRAGDPGAAQSVGQALGRNPWPVIVPCHRVLAADGSLGGFSAPGGVATKRRMLEIEGAPEAGGPMLFADERLTSGRSRQAQPAG